MKEVVLITGANGNLAKQATKALEDNFQIKLLSRKPKLSNEYLWDIDKQYIDPNSLKDVNHIIHLSGASISAKRWTAKRKQEIFSSRVNSAKLLLKQLSVRGQKISTFISASAVGYYGNSLTDSIFDEDSPPGNDFLSNVCLDWEQTALSFESLGFAEKSSILRFGIILDNTSGALKSMSCPVKLGVGSPLGKGKQWVPWIHIYDASNVIKYVLTNRLSGAFNAVSGTHTNNEDLMRAIASSLNRKLTFPNVPEFICKMIFGKMSEVFINGSRVSSEKLISKGYKFRYTDINKTLESLLS